MNIAVLLSEELLKRVRDKTFKVYEIGCDDLPDYTALVLWVLENYLDD